EADVKLIEESDDLLVLLVLEEVTNLLKAGFDVRGALALGQIEGQQCRIGNRPKLLGEIGLPTSRGAQDEAVERAWRVRLVEMFFQLLRRSLDLHGVHRVCRCVFWQPGVEGSKILDGYPVGLAKRPKIICWLARHLEHSVFKVVSYLRCTAGRDNHSFR